MLNFRILLATALGLSALQTSAQEKAGANSIEEVLVTGRAQQFYLETNTSTGSKLDIDLIDLPQSVQVLTEQLIIDQAARDITDMYRSVAGMSEFSYSGVTVRGFRESDNVYYDGVRGDPYAGFSVPQLFNVDRIEVLKGPSAALYGGGDPGGMINYMTKKPSFERSAEFGLKTGNYNLFGGSIDFRGPVSDTIAYRFGAFYEEQNSFRDNADEENTQISGALTFEPTENSSLTASVDYIDQDLGGHRLRGVLARDNGDFIADRQFNAAEEIDFQKLEAWVGQVQLQHAFSETLRVNTTVRYLDNEREQEYHEPRGWIDVNGDGVADENDEEIRREWRDQYRDAEEVSVTIDVIKLFSTGGIEHQFLVGGDYHNTDSDNELAIAFLGVPNLNVFEPNYGEADPSSYSVFDLPFGPAESEIYSLYIQDLLEFNEQWSLMIGFRYDDFEDEEEISDFSFSDDNISSRAGLIYKPVDDGSIYLNYSESFTPVGLADQLDVDATGSLDPETGHQWELGWKQNWFDGQLLTTIAIYTITKEDVPQPNPDDTGSDDGIPTLVNLGEVESEGIELTLVGDITERWTLTANYAYNDTEIKEGSSISEALGDGSRFANAPEHQAGLWTRYSLNEIDSSIAFGVNYVSKQYNLSDQKVDPFTVFDASWTTSWDDLVLQVNLSNIFDETYFVSGFSEQSGNFPGNPRELVFQLRYSL